MKKRKKPSARRRASIGIALCFAAAVVIAGTYTLTNYRKSGQQDEQEQQAENIEQFVQRVKKNGTLTELTPYALRELAKAVYVETPNKSSGKRRQKVHIEYDLVGYIPVDELLKEEQA